MDVCVLCGMGCDPDDLHRVHEALAEWMPLTYCPECLVQLVNERVGPAMADYKARVEKAEQVVTVLETTPSDRFQAALIIAKQGEKVRAITAERDALDLRLGQAEQRLEEARLLWVVCSDVYCGRSCPIGELDEAKALTAALSGEKKD